MPNNDTFQLLFVSEKKKSSIFKVILYFQKQQFPEDISWNQSTAKLKVALKNNQLAKATFFYPAGKYHAIDICEATEHSHLFSNLILYFLDSLHSKTK